MLQHGADGVQVFDTVNFYMLTKCQVTQVDNRCFGRYQVGRIVVDNVPVERIVAAVLLTQGCALKDQLNAAFALLAAVRHADSINTQDRQVDAHLISQRDRLFGGVERQREARKIDLVE